MFTAVLDTLLVFMLASSGVGILAERIGITKIRDAFAVVGFLLAGYFAFGLLGEVSKGIIVRDFSPYVPPVGACFEIDGLSVFMALTFTMLSALVSVFSIRYMEHDENLTEYYVLLFGMVAGMVGVVFAGDFFTFFIFWELMCITSYVLVGFRRRRWAPIEASFKYLIMSAFGSVTLALMMSFLYGMTGTLNFALLSSTLRGTMMGPWLYVVLIGLLIGFGIKSSIVPMHTWLPDAHPEAPSTISALLSGIIIETGLYGLARVLSLLFDLNIYSLLIAGFAVLTMTVANFLALLQEDIKRLLAYSSIAQMGYMLIGIATGTLYGIMGTFLHVFNHALMKGLAFLSIGAILHQTGTRNMRKLAGIGRSMPITFSAFTIALFGLGGIPATNGFISKFILFMSTFEVNMAWLGIIGVLNSAFSVAYYIRLVKTMITEPKQRIPVKEAPPTMLLVLCTMAFLIILFGIWPQPVLVLAERASTSLLSFQDYTRVIVG
ncbi:MAG: complex I subunit 5 family protein [Candidatus Bathyarchaeia archaeon]